MDNPAELKNLADRNFDQLKFEYLTDRQLIQVIKQAQQELDLRYPFKCLHNLKCPACGRAEQDFRISCRFTALLKQKEVYVPIDTGNKPFWGPEDGCTCSRCSHTGLVVDFLQPERRTEHGITEFV